MGHIPSLNPGFLIWQSRVLTLTSNAMARAQYEMMIYVKLLIYNKNSKQGAILRLSIWGKDTVLPRMPSDTLHLRRTPEAGNLGSQLFASPAVMGRAWGSGRAALPSSPAFHRAAPDLLATAGSGQRRRWPPPASPLLQESLLQARGMQHDRPHTPDSQQFWGPADSPIL